MSDTRIETIESCRIVAERAAAERTRKQASDELVGKVLMQMAEVGYSPSAPAYDAVKWYLEGYQLQMFGPTGNGKSSFFKALSEVRMSNGRRPFKFAVLPMSMLNVANPNDVLAFVDYHAGDELVIEDVGGECEMSDYGNRYDMFGTILTVREYTDARTHFTTNIGEDQIAKVYGRRVFSRMRGTKIVDFGGRRSYRNETDHGLVTKIPSANYMVMLNTDASRKLTDEYRVADAARRSREIADMKMKEDF